MMLIIISVIVSILVSGLVYQFVYSSSTPAACNLTSVSQRDFNKYYGLINVDSPLSYLNAEQEHNMNSKCQLFYDHMHLFSNGDLSLSQSMIIKALRGSGKTQIRQCIITKISQSNHIVVNIYGTVINNYLDNFVSNIDITNDPSHEKIRQFWTKEHLIQVILTELTSRFVDDKYLHILSKELNTISSETRHELATLLSFYSTKHPDTLCKMVNLLLGKLTNCKIIGCSIPCDNLQSIHTDTQMFIQLTRKHGEIKIIRRTPATEASLKLIQLIYEKTKILPSNCLDHSYRDQLIFLINFLKSLNIRTAVLVDSLDESKIFFDINDTNQRTLQKFVDSATDDDVLNLALGNWGGDARMSSGISFYIFVPQTPTIPIKISWTRPDKIPIIDLKWDELQLINYVDYISDYLRVRSRNKCKNLPDICTLLGGQEQCTETMKQLRHPRDFHIFFKYLTAHMSTVCKQRDPPFIATEQDLKTTLKETKEHILNETK